MRVEVLQGRESVHPLQLKGALSSAYGQFRRDKPVDVRVLYAGIDLAANVQVGLNQTNPLIEAFRLSQRSDVLPSEREYFARSSGVLLDPIKDFEGEDVDSAISSWLDTHASERRFSRFLNLVDIPIIGVLSAKGKSIGLFYEHLAGVLDLDPSQDQAGFNNPNAGYHELLIADFIHGRGRNLLLGFIRGSRLIDPPPARFDRDYDAIERFREEERNRWGVITAGDLTAMEAWQRFVDSTEPGERKIRAMQAVEKYERSITSIERLKDISAIDSRADLNPFLAL